MLAFLKSSVFTRPHDNRKTAFSKRSNLESIFEKLVYGDRKCRLRVDASPKRIKKTRFKNIRIRGDGTLVRLMAARGTLFHDGRMTKRNATVLQTFHVFCNSPGILLRVRIKKNDDMHLFERKELFINMNLRCH